MSEPQDKPQHPGGAIIEDDEEGRSRVVRWRQDARRDVRARR